jgi:Type IV secretion system proteins
MRKALFATVAAFVLGLGIAHAQLVVVDPTAIAREAAEAAVQLRTLQQQFQQLITTYQTLAHLTNINGMAPGLSNPNIQNPFGGITPQNGIMQGGTFNGLGQAQGQAQTLYNGQLVPQNMTQQQSAAFMGQWINQRSMSLSSIQALALTLYNGAQSRSGILPQLQSQLQAAPDVTTVTAINGRIAIEQNYLQSAQTQAAELTALEQSQARLAENQILQKKQNDTQQALTDNPVNLGGL